MSSSVLGPSAGCDRDRARPALGAHTPLQMPRPHGHSEPRVDVLPERTCCSGPSPYPDESRRGLASRFCSPRRRPTSIPAIPAHPSRATPRSRASPLRKPPTPRNQTPQIPPTPPTQPTPPPPPPTPSPPTTTTTNTIRAPRSSRLLVEFAVARIGTRSIERRRALDSSNSRRVPLSERLLQPASPPASRLCIPLAPRPVSPGPDRPERPDGPIDGEPPARLLA
jgi:hypothetical protein